MPTCGNCKQHHATSLEVRDCYGIGRLQRATATATVTEVKYATPPQVNLINKLLSEREVPASTETSIRLQLAARMPRRSASTTIDWLYTRPLRLTARVDDVQIVSAVKPGTYTVVKDDGLRRTIRVREVTFATDLPAGSLVLDYLNGPDNENDYTSYAFVVKGKLRVWNRFKSNTSLIEFTKFLLGANSAQLAGFGEAYALESNRCFRCNRKLTVPASVHRGLGPHCAKIAS